MNPAGYGYPRCSFSMTFYCVSQVKDRPRGARHPQAPRAP